MSGIIQTPSLGNIATNPTIYNITMTTANTEYSQALPSGVKKITFGVQTADAICRHAFVTGKVATPTAPYIQAPTGMFVSEDNINLNGITLYFASPIAGKVMQIYCWV